MIFFNNLSPLSIRMERYKSQSSLSTYQLFPVTFRQVTEHLCQGGWKSIERLISGCCPPGFTCFAGLSWLLWHLSHSIRGMPLWLIIFFDLHCRSLNSCLVPHCKMVLCCILAWWEVKYTLTFFYCLKNLHHLALNCFHCLLRKSSGLQ